MSELPCTRNGVTGTHVQTVMTAGARLGPMSFRSMALREFALGIESLERVVRREPLRRVHECVFGVLALESEPVDPRLQRDVRCRKASSTFFRVLEGTVQYRNMNRAFEIARIWSISKSVSYFRSAVF
jgi:hypothetical protein